MTRIVAGSAGGRRLAVPSGRGTRPTADRTREALFSSVQALLGTLDGARVLDLYAGSGAVGLEAISRGAAAATLVESDPGAAATARSNARALDMPAARVLSTRAERLAQAPPPADPYDLVFADPPYDLPAGELALTLARLAGRGWLAEGALVVVERSRREPDFPWPAGFAARTDRRYGEARLASALWYGRPAGSVGGSAGAVEAVPIPAEEP